MWPADGPGQAINTAPGMDRTQRYRGPEPAGEMPARRFSQTGGLGADHGCECVGRQGPGANLPGTDQSNGRTMAHDLKDMRIAIMAADGVERVELEQPRGALYGADARSDLLSIHPGEIQARQFDLVSAGTFPVDRLVSDASPGQYDALLLPGGVVNPDKLRTSADAVGFVKAFVGAGKPVAAICHGPWTLIEADVVRGHRLTSWPSLWTDLRNAGAEAIDQDVVIDGQFTTSRSPADLPAFCAAIISQFASAGAAR